MAQETLEFMASDERAGFRLARVEVYNWGTFHQHIWRIKPGGENALLTGDIGSGKSTLVDAITTLLVPHQRIVYNRAAGAEGKERTLYSYVRGEYKGEKNELSGTSRAVALREKNTYSVLLAYFYNEGLDQGLSLAQVFWLQDSSRTPAKFFLTANADLTIARDFSDFGDSVPKLKQRLRRDERVQLSDTFKDYSQSFRQTFGIQNDQALNLFYQTVSMKSVGNLTDFVRDHMLESYAVQDKIEKLCQNFENLNRAHETVLRARRQIELLAPLARGGRRFQRLSGVLGRMQQAREMLVAYFASLRVGILGEAIAEQETKQKKTAARLEQSKSNLAGLQRKASALRASIDQAGGNRIREVEAELERLEKDKKRIRDRYDSYIKCARAVELAGPRDADTFVDNQDLARTAQTRVEERARHLETEVVDARLNIRDLKKQEDDLESELKSLRKRKNNIPEQSLRIRTELAETLGLNLDQLPFSGELIQVSEREKAWQGALERLLHSFALSMLVPERLYTAVARYVDRNNLRGRLVYYRVPHNDRRPPAEPDRLDAVIRKLQIQSKSPLADWLGYEIRRRFRHACTDSDEAFAREPQALSLQGQIKSAGGRHEKDDRHALNNPGRYVLGWNNRNKIKALESELAQVQQKGAAEAQILARLTGEQHGLTTQRDALLALLSYTEWTEIDWQPVASEIEIWQKEKSDLEKSSNVLRDLQRQLEENAKVIAAEEQNRDRLIGTGSKIETLLEGYHEQLSETERTLGGLERTDRERWFAYLAPYRHRAADTESPTLVSLDRLHQNTRGLLQTRIDSANAKIGRLREKLSQQISAYRHAFPAESTELGSDLEALGEYITRLIQLRDEDLPRHETRFKEMLNKETINSIALFKNELESAYADVGEKIRSINRSLREIEYNSGSYIELDSSDARDSQISDFRHALRECLSQGLNEAEVYTERKFEQVKAIIDRFNGREGFADSDRKWTDRVTDVRNWLAFSAVERWAEDDSEKEHYSDSAGKSGGQKEKLAYTILASALAYQFGLEWDRVRSRSFRFVVIDEAFGRGSDESTRFGLELFKKLKLQLLIVTPLQKIHIIEDYVRAVHFVHNEGGSKSVIQNMTIEEHREKRREYQERAPRPQTDVDTDTDEPA